MKVYVVSSGNMEFHRVEAVRADWNQAMKYAIEEDGAREEIRDNKKERNGQTVWEYWNADGEFLHRVTQLDLS